MKENELIIYMWIVVHSGIIQTFWDIDKYKISYYEKTGWWLLVPDKSIKSIRCHDMEEAIQIGWELANGIEV